MTSKKTVKMSTSQWIMIILISIGAFYHLPILMGYDIVTMLFGFVPMLPMIVQLIVGSLGGISLVWAIIGLIKFRKK